MKRLFKPQMIMFHIIYLGLLFFISMDLFSGHYQHPQKDLVIAICIIGFGYPLVLILFWLLNRIEVKEHEKEVKNPMTPEQRQQSRRRWRRFGIVYMYLFGAFCVFMGYRGWSVNMIPTHYLGYGVIGLGVAGSLGLNIWYKGPLDPQDDLMENQGDES